MILNWAFSLPLGVWIWKITPIRFSPRCLLLFPLARLFATQPSTLAGFPAYNCTHLRIYAMHVQFTAVFCKVPEGYIGFVEELPGANTQGATLEEARENLPEAVALVLEANRHLAEEELRGTDVIREPLKLTA
jgi:predicted RNase H-like HicB family nuclease